MLTPSLQHRHLQAFNCSWIALIRCFRGPLTLLSRGVQERHKLTASIQSAGLCFLLLIHSSHGVGLLTPCLGIYSAMKSACKGYKILSSSNYTSTGLKAYFYKNLIPSFLHSNYSWIFFFFFCSPFSENLFLQRKSSSLKNWKRTI